MSLDYGGSLDLKTPVDFHDGRCVQLQKNGGRLPADFSHNRNESCIFYPLDVADMKPAPFKSANDNTSICSDMIDDSVSSNS